MYLIRKSINALKIFLINIIINKKYSFFYKKKSSLLLISHQNRNLVKVNPFLDKKTHKYFYSKTKNSVNS